VNFEHASAVAAEASSIAEAKAISEKKSYLKSYVDLSSTLS